MTPKEQDVLKADNLRMKAALIKIADIISFFPSNRASEQILKLIRDAIN